MIGAEERPSIRISPVVYDRVLSDGDGGKKKS